MDDDDVRRQDVPWLPETPRAVRRLRWPLVAATVVVGGGLALTLALGDPGATARVAPWLATGLLALAALSLAAWLSAPRSGPRRRPSQPPARGELPDYESGLAQARRAVVEGRLEQAARLARDILALAPERPEALVLLGAMAELEGDRLRALAFYRAALALDPTNNAARLNLEQATRSEPGGPPTLGGLVGLPAPRAKRRRG